MDKNSENQVQDDSYFEFALPLAIDKPISISKVKDNDLRSFWNDLPSIPLQSVYSYLDDGDKLNMSLVCKNWSQDFAAPCNWQEMELQFPYRSTPHITFPAIKYALRYGHMIRHAKIICSRSSLSLVELGVLQFCTFCEILAESATLKTLRIENLKSLFRWTSRQQRANVLSSLKILLRSQRILDTLVISFSYFTKQEAMAILEPTFIEDGIPFKQIKFKRFVVREDDQEEGAIENDSDNENISDKVDSVLWFSGCLNSLMKWETDYSSVFEDVIIKYPILLEEDNLVKGISIQQGVLKELIICFEGWMQDTCHGLSANDWKQFTSIFPKLLVDMKIYSSMAPKTHFEFVVVKFVPIRLLEFTVTNASRNETMTSEYFFSRLVEYNVHYTIEQLHLLWQISGTENVMIDLNFFVRKCRKLKQIQIQVRWPFQFNEIVLQSWIENPPVGLETVHLTVTHIPSIEIYEDISFRADNFIPILQVMGITFLLILENNRRW